MKTAKSSIGSKILIHFSLVISLEIFQKMKMKYGCVKLNLMELSFITCANRMKTKGQNTVMTGKVLYDSEPFLISSLN